MSIFDKVVAAHDAAKAADDQAKAKAASDAAVASAGFKQAFTDAVANVARPIFEQFVSDAQKHGFPAAIDGEVDGYGNLVFSLRIVPIRGSDFASATRIQEAVFSLRGFIKEQKVEHASYYDQRLGEKGVKKGTFGIASINKSVLERDLEEFLTAALKARG